MRVNLTLGCPLRSSWCPVVPAFTGHLAPKYREPTCWIFILHRPKSFLFFFFFIWVSLFLFSLFLSFQFFFFSFFFFPFLVVSFLLFLGRHANAYIYIWHVAVQEKLTNEPKIKKEKEKIRKKKSKTVLFTETDLIPALLTPVAACTICCYNCLSDYETAFVDARISSAQRILEFQG